MNRCRIEVDELGYRWYVCDEDSALPLRSSEFIVYSVLKDLAEPSRVFVDVGAHVGRYAIRLAKHFRKVVAIEPIPRNVEILRKNIELNSVSNIEVLQIAAGDRRGRIEISNAGSHSSVLDASTSKDKVYVDMYPLDEVIDRVDVVKIDVEGYEIEVVKGMRRIIAECRPILVIEHHEFYRPSLGRSTLREIAKMLSDYIAWRIGEAHFIWVPKEVDILKERSRFRTAIYAFWCFHVLENIASNRPWYLGLPETWWWGMSPIEFMLKLPEHIAKEDSWFVEAKKLLEL